MIMRELRYSIPGFFLASVIILYLISSPLFIKQYVENQSIGQYIVFGIITLIATPATGYIISSIYISWFYYKGGYSGLWEKKLKYSIRDEIKHSFMEKNKENLEIFNAPEDSFLSFYWQSRYVDLKLIEWVSRRMSVSFINQCGILAIIFGNLLSICWICLIQHWECNCIYLYIIIFSLITIWILWNNHLKIQEEAIGVMNIWLYRTSYFPHISNVLSSI